MIEDKFDMTRACFWAIKQNRFNERAKRIARGTFGLTILRKSFESLKSWNIKQKLLKVSYKETIMMRKLHAFRRWLSEHDKSLKGREANAIINFDRVHIVL